MSDKEEEEADDSELIKYSGNYGSITNDSKFWDDFEDIGEEEVLLKSKIVKVKIYTGKYRDKDVLIGVGFNFKNIYTGEITSQEHIGSEQFEEVKELDIKDDEFLVDFFISFKYEAEYISQVGFQTNKGNKIFIGTEEGENHCVCVESNGGDNIIVGTFGCYDKKLDAMGILYVKRKDFFRIVFPYFPLLMLRYLIETDEEFKKEIENNYYKFHYDFKYIWRTANLPNDSFKEVVKYISPM